MAWIHLASLLLLLLLLLLLSCLAETSYGGILLSSLPNTLDVFASPHKPDQPGLTPGGAWYFTDPIIAGEDKLGVTWALNNRSFPVGTDAPYKKINVKLCYAPVSQVGRPERETVDDLDKDKTCQFDIFAGQYNASSKWQYYESTLDRNVSAASYFVRAYVLDAAAVVVAYGQSTGPNKDYNIFEVQASNGSHETPSSGSHKTPSSGSHKTLDIVFICFNALDLSNIQCSIPCSLFL